MKIWRVCYYIGMKKIVKKEDLKNLAKEIIGVIKNRTKEGAVILALSGDLGAGKTTFTKEIAKHFKIKKEIVSPTFVIMKNYEIKDDKFKNLIHIDAYRLEKGEDLKVLGWQELINNKNNLIIIEWPEMAESHLPKDTFVMKISHRDEETRIFEICYNVDNGKRTKYK